LPDEAELLYAALAAPLGVVVRCNPQRLRSTRQRLLQKDAALMDLHVLGPDASGQLWIVRSLQANEELEALRREKDHE
jgi:hypothetical protein